MLRSFFLMAILLTLLVGFCEPSPPKHFSIQPLAPGAWAAIHNDKGGYAISNAGIIDLGDKTLIFDAFINPDAAMELKAVAEQLTKHKVAFVINSHYHDDHVRGDQAFVSGASVVSTEWTRNEIEKTEPEEREWLKKNIQKQLEKAKQLAQRAPASEKEEDIMWLNYYESIAQSLPKLKMILPDITFRDSMWIHGSERSVLLLECHNGHTPSDAVMILPGEGIAFMGDLLFVDRHPWFGDGDPDSLKKHLQRFYADTSLKQFVPGHGTVAGKESLLTLIKYTTDLQQLASDAIQEGEADSIFTRSPVLPAYKTWWFGRFYADNLQVVYDKAKAKK
jgi:glyoxylase-like metal-dependent hydrolase (beta-lactamase superfamily II)